MPDIDLAAHQPGFRPFLVRGEMWAYWTVYDGVYEPVDVADVYLRRVRFGSGMALGTTRMYASNLALFFEFCLATGRSLRRAALELDRFMHYLVVTPIERRGRGQGQLRSRERVNHILVAVRELYREAVARGLLGAESPGRCSSRPSALGNARSSSRAASASLLRCLTSAIARSSRCAIRFARRSASGTPVRERVPRSGR